MISKEESREDYLERILMLKERMKVVRAIDIATDMGFSKPSISVALKKLKNDELITIENNNIDLTEKGLEIAKNVYERHQIISNLLIKLGVDKTIALEDACKIEHDLSPETFDKIKEYYLKTK